MLIETEELGHVHARDPGALRYLEKVSSLLCKELPLKFAEPVKTIGFSPLSIDDHEFVVYAYHDFRVFSGPQHPLGREVGRRGTRIERAEAYDLVAFFRPIALPRLPSTGLPSADRTALC
jgi:hypothetical protein